MINKLLGLGLLSLVCVFSIHAQDALPEPEPPVEDTRPIDYLIIHANSLKDSAWKWSLHRSKTRQVSVVAMSKIGKNPDVDEIRDYIKDAAGGEKIREGFQVLLIGDCPDEGKKADPEVEIPWQLTNNVDANPTPARRSRVPTDNVYADLIEDRDARPDIAVGRIPARTNEEVERALAKVQAYEKAPLGDWSRNLTFFAGEGRFGVVIDRLLENLFKRFVEQTINQAYDVRMTYANVASSYAYVPRQFSDKVIEEANAGALMLVYMGHGSHDRLDDMHVGETRYPILKDTDVSKFAIKDGQLPIMLILACQTGALDHAKGCLAETICFTENAPVAVVASSRDCHPYSNVLLQKSLTGEITENRVETLGEAFLKGKQELVDAKDPKRAELEGMARWVIPNKKERDSLNRAHLALYNLIGDPGLRLRHPNCKTEIGTTDDDGFKAQTEISVNQGDEFEFAVRFAPALGVPVTTSTAPPKDDTLEIALETRRSVIAHELKSFERADLTSDDPDARKKAESIVAENHALSNDKRVDGFTFSGGNIQTSRDSATHFFSGKIPPSLEAGDYILKVLAHDSQGKVCGFVAVQVTVKEKEK